MQVRLVNRDEHPIVMTSGGNYRSGREARWNIEVRDAKGRLMPPIDWGGDQGGMSHLEPFAPGQAIVTTLPLARYVEPLAPGDYRVRVHYHDTATIADPWEFPRRITVESEEVALRVLPRVVATTTAEQARIARLVESLPSTGRVDLIEGPYGAWAHVVIAPESVPGKILDAGWASVPALLRFARSNGGDAIRRSWALALLHGIWDAFAPFDSATLGARAWYVERSGHADLAGWASDGRIDASAQTRLAERWATIADGVEFREAR